MAKHKQYFNLTDNHIALLKSLLCKGDHNSIIMSVPEKIDFYVWMSQILNVPLCNDVGLPIESTTKLIYSVWAGRITALQIVLSNGKMKKGRYWNNGIDNVWKNVKKLKENCNYEQL